ncbi:hypothetical protein CEP54_010177 [Fusarium duplospermum]|uniref:Uncharacterized protein n=1 Tax=Fusarium duplospermum TaxID=1325734 RepID=A0A428PLJ6_9HYPO|nr:hypothetical protein CEP54_010177 [Fusarium duplospermum]
MDGCDEAEQVVQPFESTMDTSPMDTTTEANRDEESPLDADGSLMDDVGPDPKSDDDDGNADDTNSSHVTDPEVISMDLTPIENNMPRDYIDIAVAFPCPRVSYFEAQLLETERETFRAFYQALQRWPFLAGTIKVTKGEHGDKLTLVHSRGLTRDIVSRLYNVQLPRGGGCEEAIISPHDAPMSCFRRDCFFPHDQDVDNADDFPPVTLQINFKDGMLVLGFSLNRVMFDGLAINNFLRQYLRNTARYRTTHPVTSRDMPDTIDPGPDNGYNLPFWEWDQSCTPELPTPRGNLMVHTFYFKARVINRLRRRIREHDVDSQSSCLPAIQDCVFALFWVIVMRARCETGMLIPSDAVSAHVMKPGFSKKPHPWEYIGNSTVDAVATCHATDLAGPFVTWNDEEFKITESRRLAYAAQLLNTAQQKIDNRYMKKLHGLKQAISPAEDKLASDRALRRHTTSVCFEDWTGYASYCEGELPFITDTQPSIFACPDQLNEGDVVLLPREDKTSGPEDWAIAVCFTRDDIDTIEGVLYSEEWLSDNDDDVYQQKPKLMVKPQRVLKPKGMPEGHGKEGKFMMEY